MKGEERYKLFYELAKELSKCEIESCNSKAEYYDEMTEIIVYDVLSNETLKKIARREINRVIDQVNDSQIINCKIEVGDDTMDWLVAQIDGNATGARSVQRLIEATVSRKISDSFIHGKIKDGGEYTLSVGDDNTLGLKSVA